MNKITQHLKYILLGTLMGFIVARIGFSNYEQLHNMFVFSDLRMLYAFMAAVALSMVIFFIFSYLRTRNLPENRRIFTPGTIPGSMLFGFGWAICGACPSIVFVQLAEGKLAAVFTLIGIYIGVVWHKKMHSRYFRWDTGSCGV